jgi:hypothetical protein
MYMKKELDNLRNSIHKAYKRTDGLRAAANNDSGAGLSDEMHKLTAELETVALQARNLDEAIYTDGDILTKRPYNKNWSADVSGHVEVDSNGWLHIVLNTLLPHCKYQSSPYLKDTIIRLLSNYQLNGGTLPYYSVAMLVIDEHCNIENRQVYDHDNKGWKVISNALKGLVIKDDDQFSLGLTLISTWSDTPACYIHVMDIGDFDAYVSLYRSDYGSYFKR